MSISIWDDMKDTESKLTWTSDALPVENEFCDRLAPLIGVDIAMNPEKTTNPYAPDLIRPSGQLADLKQQTTPFFMAQEKYGLDPQYVVTFNHKDYERYKKLYPDIHLYFWVRWDRTVYPKNDQLWVDSMEGVWETPFSKIAELVEKNKLFLHYYERRLDDFTGNARASFLINLKRFKEVSILRKPENICMYGKPKVIDFDA